jgi:ribose 5-phosphate isomerase B|tara:strand:+ start:618091 stop:618570 length:480 start_codon:yes stop_codon:yes gene_type:complete
MKVYLAADHAGFALKGELLKVLEGLGHEVSDLGAFSFDPSDDYPDVVTPLAHKIARDPHARGIICAGSGQGEAMCANRIKGVRAAVFYAPRAAAILDQEGSASEDEYDLLRLTRTHNDANVLSLGARFLTLPEAMKAVELFLTTPFSNDERHQRRISKF